MVDIADLFVTDEAVKQRMGYIARYDHQELLKALDSSQLSEVMPTVALTIELAKKCVALPFSILPSDKLKEINDTSREVLSRFEEIQKHSSEEVKSKDIDALLSATNSNCQLLQNLIIPTYAYLSLNTSDIKIQETDRLLNDLQKTVAAELDAFKGKKAELDSIIEVARDTQLKQAWRSMQKLLKRLQWNTHTVARNGSLPRAY